VQVSVLAEVIDETLLFSASLKSGNAIRSTENTGIKYPCTHHPHQSFFSLAPKSALLRSAGQRNDTDIVMHYFLYFFPSIYNNTTNIAYN
jgi:hypothetical protein